MPRRSHPHTLPAEPYEYAEWVERKVGLDYHVEVGKHYYSVPHRLLKQKLWARVAARTVEIFHNGERVAAHVRTSGNRQHTTVPEHMPASHRRYAGWTPGGIRRQAERIGPGTGALVDLILKTKTHLEQGFRACLGIVRLAKPHGRDALEAACQRALEIGGTSYSSVSSILKNNLRRTEGAPRAPVARLWRDATGPKCPRRGRRSPIRTSAGRSISTEEENDARPPDTRPAAIPEARWHGGR